MFGWQLWYKLCYLLVEQSKDRLLCSCRLTWSVKFCSFCRVPARFMSPNSDGFNFRFHVDYTFFVTPLGTACLSVVLRVYTCAYVHLCACLSLRACACLPLCVPDVPLSRSPKTKTLLVDALVPSGKPSIFWYIDVLMPSEVVFYVGIKDLLCHVQRHIAWMANTWLHNITLILQSRLDRSGV